MEFHLDRRVVLSTESEFKSLYKWSLQELDADGKKVGRDQIPWAWSLDFAATELALQDDFNIERDYDSDDIEKKAIREQRSITAKLSPSGRHLAVRDTVYSMFGANRTITDFFLAIYPIAGEEEQERCTAWGSVSYTAEVDFVYDTEPDIVGFYLRVRPETFARYAAMIAASEVDEAVFKVGNVAGFYSEWSPAISTNSVKVLTKNEEHKVDIPDDCEIVPPRLGAVGEAQLYLRRISKLRAATAALAVEDDARLGEVALPERGMADDGERVFNRLIAANTRAIKLLSSLRIAAWIIAILLFLILIKQF